MNSIKSCNFKYYGSAYNKTLHIPLNNGASALLISSNFGYGVGGIFFLEYIESLTKYRASLVFGNEAYTNITSSGASIDVTSSASNDIYVAEF